MTPHNLLALKHESGMSLPYIKPVQHLYKVWEVLPINIRQYSKGLSCMHEQHVLFCPVDLITTGQESTSHYSWKCGTLQSHLLHTGRHHA